MEWAAEECAADSCPYQARTWDIQLALHSPHFRSCVSESKALPCHLCLNVACEHLIPRADATTVTLLSNSVSGLGNDGLELCCTVVD